jgi:hypothetical protein
MFNARVCFLIVAPLVVWLFTACAPSLHYGPGRQLLSAGEPVADPARQPNASDTLVAPGHAGLAVPPDSIDAELVFVAHEGRRKTEVTGRLFARPGSCGKLDLYGLPGMLGGAFRWQNADWELAIYDPPRYDSGSGARVPLPLPGGAEAPYDALFSPLWGALLPWMPGAPLKRDSVRPYVFSGPGEGGNWRVAFAAKSGLPDTLWDSQGWALSYSHWRQQGGRLLPGRITCAREGVVWLEVVVRQVRDNPAWRRNPFVLRKPKGMDSGG